MLDRIATFSSSGSMLSAALRTQAKLAEEQIQESSGKVSADYGGLGAKAGQVVSLEVAVSRSSAYADAATGADSRVNLMSSALTSIGDVLTQFRAALTEASSNVGNQTTLPQVASGLLDDLAAQLNTQYQGRYLFAGSATTVKPVDLSTLAASTDFTTADTSYYQGNADAVSVRVSPDQTVSYGVVASDASFEKAIRVLNAFANMGSSDISSTTLADAATDVEGSLDGVLAVQGRLSVQSATLQRAAGDQQTFQDYASNLSSSLTDVDVASVTAQMASYQTQLQASYAAISKISSLRLMDYLK